MTDAKHSLGQRPRCGHEIPPGLLLLEYETDDGETGIWAECPRCDDVVDPE